MVDRDEFFDWLQKNQHFVQFIVHLGARTDTAEMDMSVFDKLNLDYSKTVWKNCVEYGLPLIYASSAATYGSGEYGYDDCHALISQLKPLNPYGISKNEFDKWVITQENKPYFWVGLKFFNVYGPGVNHLLIYDLVNKLKSNPYNLEIEGDGQQIRDYLYIDDAVNALILVAENGKPGEDYNTASGKPVKISEIAKMIIQIMGYNKTKIEYTNHFRKGDIKAWYADISKISNLG